jgi:hypothetical protein
MNCERGKASAIKRVDAPSPQHEVRVVSGAKEPLAAGRHALIVLMPAETAAGLEGGLDLRARPERGRRQLKCATYERGAVLVGKGHGLLRGQLVALRDGIVGHEPAGRLRVQPLADVPFGRAGLFSELLRSYGLAVRHRLVESEPVADHDQAGIHRRSKLANHLAEKGVELVLVDRLCLNCHPNTSRKWDAPNVGATPGPSHQGGPLVVGRTPVSPPGDARH